jgi:sporulation protein YlmC with PRC-barrel domain
MAATDPAHPPRRLIATSKVAGTAVFNLKGERLGHIDQLMIDKPTGRVAYAVLAFGGFLGFNDRHYPLPWNVLRYEHSVDGYVVDVDRELLEQAPAFIAGGEPSWAEHGWGQVDAYYDKADAAPRSGGI